MTALPDPYDDPAFYDDLIPKRFLAWVVDLAITLVLVVLALALTGFIAIIILPLVWMGVAITYRTLMLDRFGATAGMMLVALEWRRLDGRRADTTLALWHSAIYALSMSFILGQLISVLLMVMTPYKQGLNDKILGTVIVNRSLVS
ncbi:RDD family protein [Pararhodobacter sp.]|uniref:RDD family protein n=1 Tax=Pararhodobacter sp. TaxID=2127056 RepID=UPI002FE32B8B